MSATILSFPVQTQCPCCGRPCGEDELSACYECGGKPDKAWLGPRAGGEMSMLTMVVTPRSTFSKDSNR